MHSKKNQLFFKFKQENFQISNFYQNIKEIFTLTFNLTVKKGDLSALILTNKVSGCKSAIFFKCLSIILHLS